MLAVMLLALGVHDWVPARWYSSDPKTLELIADTPINCLLIEDYSPQFAAEAAKRGIVLLGVVRPGGDLNAMAKLDGMVLEGEFERAAVEKARRLAPLVIELPPRSRISFDGVPVVGTTQALWPGVHVEEGGAARAAPTGGPWIDTNAGFLRFVRALTDAPVWLGNTPPPKTVLPVDRYLHAIADAAISGARWIVALDADFNRRLLAREEKALHDWRRIAAHLKFYEDHKEWRYWKPWGKLVLVQDADSGALFSGGVLDMIVVKHTPVRPVPRSRLSAAALEGALMAVAVDPAALSPEQKEALREIARRGGTVLSGPPGWKFPPARSDQITLGKQEQDTLNDIWRDVNALIGRRNLGARLFNVSAMLSNLLASPDGKQILLHLVNYSDYKVENITAHLSGKFRRARLYAPEAAPRDIEVYPIEDGAGVDIDQVSVCAALVLD